MDERKIQAMMVKGANVEGYALFKMSDAPGMDKRPADISGLSLNGRGTLVEVKMHPPNDTKPIPWGEFQKHQKDWLHHYAETNVALAVVALYDAGTGNVTLFRLLPLTTSRMDKSDPYKQRDRPSHVLVREGDMFVNWPDW